MANKNMYLIVNTNFRFKMCLDIFQKNQIQNLFLTAQSTQIKSVISVPIKDFIHHYPRALFNDIHRVGAYFYNIHKNKICGE